MSDCWIVYIIRVSETEQRRLPETKILHFIRGSSPPMNFSIVDFPAYVFLLKSILSMSLLKCILRINK